MTKSNRGYIIEMHLLYIDELTSKLTSNDRSRTQEIESYQNLISNKKKLKCLTRDRDLNVFCK